MYTQLGMLSGPLDPTLKCSFAFQSFSRVASLSDLSLSSLALPGVLTSPVGRVADYHHMNQIKGLCLLWAKSDFNSTTSLFGLSSALIPGLSHLISRLFTHESQ